MFKKFLLIIGLFTIFNHSFETFAEIIPLKKPIQTIKEKEQKLLIDVLKPLQKPLIKKVIKNEQKQPNYKKVTKKKVMMITDMDMKVMRMVSLTHIFG